MISGAISIVVNLALCLLLSGSMDVAGLSIATAVSSMVSAVLLLIPMLRRYPGVLGKRFWIGILKMLCCTLGMGVVVWLTGRSVALWLQDGMLRRLLQVGIPTVAGIAAYFILALVLGLEELQALRSRLKRT